MIAKITKGKAMKSLAKYLLHGSNNESPNRGKLLATNFAGSDVRSWSREFAEFRRLKPNLSRAVTHISLNIAPDDRQISDAEFIDIANRFKEGLGYTDDCPFLLIRHADREHQHVHLMLSRISLNGVIAETNDFRKAEKLAVALRKEFGLKGPADKKNNRETDMKTQRSLEDIRNEAITEHLEAVSQEMAAKLAAETEPDAPTIEPLGPVSVKMERDMRREIQSPDYRKAIDGVFSENVRYVRNGKNSLRLFFTDSTQLHDNGSKLRIYGKPSPEVAAARLMALVAMKGWDAGFVVRGGDEFIRQVAILAMQNNLPIVPLNAHQLAIILSVRDSAGQATSDIAAPQHAATQVSSLLPLREMTGIANVGNRLNDLREDDDDVMESEGRRPAVGKYPKP